MDEIEREPGAYTIRADNTVTGRCAGCLGQVTGDDAFVIRYHAMRRGGVFHARCEPQGEGWYDVTGEAPNV